MELADSRRISAWGLAALVLVTGSLTAFFLRPRELETSQEVKSELPAWAEVKVSLGIEHSFRFSSRVS